MRLQDRQPQPWIAAPPTIAPAGQASPGTDNSGPAAALVVGVVIAGFVGYELLKYSLKQYAR